MIKFVLTQSLYAPSVTNSFIWKKEKTKSSFTRNTIALSFYAKLLKNFNLKKKWLKLS